METVYDGPTRGGGIPDLPEDFVFDASIPTIDSGVIVLDPTCCQTNFGISDQEPALAVTALLRIDLGAFSAGVPLTRAAGRWTASACFPVNQSAPYAYEFTHDAGWVDAGVYVLEDGGQEGRERIEVDVTRRSSDDEPGFDLADGTRTNFFKLVTTCDGLDGSVPP
jgi:hypothetical protein